MDDRVDALIAAFVEETGGRPEDWVADWRPSYNIRPTDEIPILLATPVDRTRPEAGIVHRAELARWWLTPPFARELKTRAPTFNARSETVVDRPSFRGSVPHRRAVIPAAGYYEWEKSASGSTPYFIHSEGDLLYLAGLYSWWADPAADAADPARWHLTATILTRAAVGGLARIHDRTPLTLPADLVRTWVDPRVVGDRALVDAAVEAATPVAEALAFHRVASPVTGDGPGLIAQA